MPTTPLVSAVTQGDLTTTFQTIYTVPSGLLRVGLDAITFNNYSDSSASFSVRIVQSGTATDLNEIITDKSLRSGSNDLAPAMIGQALNTGGIVQVKASANDAINMTMTITTVST